MICAMVAGTALVIVVAPRASHQQTREPPVRQHEAPWLTPEAAAQIVGHEGSLGPLFEGAVLGGPAPSQELRARIAEFARRNHVEIDLEVIDDELAAVRFDVSFAGCCGYEGADVLALRFARPQTETCCMCGESKWLDDWATTTADGVYMRARIRVNRLVARWERTITLPELIERADGLLGMNATKFRHAAGDRWTELELDHRALIEMPYPFIKYAQLQSRYNLGVEVRVERDRIVEVSLQLRDLDDESTSELAPTVRARWGRPRVVGDDWIWRTRDRIITAQLDPGPTRITIAAR
jgi:hypothetical protein